jgi:hypothetical protein
MILFARVETRAHKPIEHQRHPVQGTQPAIKSNSVSAGTAPIHEIIVVSSLPALRASRLH